ncbi:hypothetical protein Tco_0826318 [Tanacetum coccineum]
MQAAPGSTKRRYTDKKRKGRWSSKVGDELCFKVSTLERGVVTIREAWQANISRYVDLFLGCCVLANPPKLGKVKSLLLKCVESFVLEIPVEIMERVRGSTIEFERADTLGLMVPSLGNL